MSLNLFRRLDRYDRRIRQLERTEPEAGSGGGGDHADSDHADAFSALGHAHAGTYAPVEHDSSHDDRFALIEHDSAHSDAFSALAHTHAVHADTDHDDRFSLLAHAHTGTYAPLEHDSAHDDRFSLLAHTHAAHADSDHDDRFALIEHDSAHSDAFAALAAAVPVGGTTGQVLTKTSATNYATAWQTGAAHADSDHDDRFVQLPGGWQTPAYFTGWGGTTLDGTRAARFRLEGDVVRVDGTVARASGSLTTIFTLPSGYRPDALRLYYVSGGGTTQNRISVQASGVVERSGGGTDYTRVSLDGITFPIT